MRIYFKVFETPIIVGEKKIFTKQPPYDPITKVVDFKGLDFNCSDIVKVFNINSNQYKVLNQYFIPYSTDINREFIDRAFKFCKGWGLKIELKEDEMDYLAKYPESLNAWSANNWVEIHGKQKTATYQTAGQLAFKRRQYWETIDL